MTWTKLEPTRIGRVVGVSLSISREKNTKNEARLFLRVNGELIKAAGIPPGRSQVDLFIGEGDEAGQMRIVPAKRGTFLCRPPEKTGAFTIGAVSPPHFPRELKTRVCEVLDAGKDGIVFALPFELPEAKEKRKQEIVREHADWCADREVKNPLAIDLDAPLGIEPDFVSLPGKPAPPKAAKAAPAPKPTPKPTLPAALKPLPGWRTFQHGKDTVALSPAHHAVTEKLKAALGRGFIPYDTLMQAGKFDDVDALRMSMETLKKKLWPLGLRIGEQKRMGYYMRDADDHVPGELGAANGAGA